jgi:hypothetical protein
LPGFRNRPESDLEVRNMTFFSGFAISGQREVFVKKRQGIDSIRYLTDVLFEPHFGQAPTYNDDWRLSPPREASREQGSDGKRSWMQRLRLRRLFPSASGTNG